MTSDAFDYYIPVRKSEIVSAILHHEALSTADRPQMASLIRWLALLFHMEFFSTSEHIKELYVGLNPDQKGDYPLETSPGQRRVAPSRARLLRIARCPQTRRMMTGRSDARKRRFIFDSKI